MSEFMLNSSEDARATLILAHGAGAGAASEFMQSMAELLSKHHINVVRFNFPYMQTMVDTGKRRPPDRMPKLQECFTQVVSTVRHSRPNMPLFIGGKSMGGRVATMLCDTLPVLGAVVFGYPFHPPGKPEKLRTEHLEISKKPVLIVQGERDTFGRKDEVLGYSLAKSVVTHFLQDGDHSFKPRKSSGFTQSEHLKVAAQQCVNFIEKNR